ncbi:hypothetical protein PPL_06972 [Heterostelium album PN500]|uniref:Transglutaminase-like domain-containing protein n=1 Tax=Heterostelium pallidum (strain ATCC 26659 / Pp 5 / PN500) TaxID=670386 RepID=D3BE19_HETP5|nr:hypothetical protein PPL_06972 [Heterostelium album PN500]EFA80150.1 hypothetical protein PPL_06972 [Heterostelium album PN500]|eukprot:XP_020432270.1 hypothetical protein PPL_06972 [Heterostelium album PN500]
MSILQKIKNTISGGPSKSDVNFENTRKEFKYVSEYVFAIHTSLQKRVKNLKKTFLHIDCVGKTITKYYHNDHPLAANCIETNKLIENSFNNWNDSNQQNYETIGRTVARIKSIKDSISTRDQYLMDLENSDSKLKSLREKPPKDPSKLPAEENNNKLKKQSYQQKNTSVMQEIFQFFEEKNDIFDLPLMQIQESLSNLFQNIHNNLFECSEVLQKPPPKNNPVSNYMSGIQTNSTLEVDDYSPPPSSSSYGNNAYQPNSTPMQSPGNAQPTPSQKRISPPPQQPPQQQQQQQQLMSPPTLSGPPVDLVKPYEPFTKKKLLVHNEVLFPGHQSPAPPQQQTYNQAPSPTQPQPVTLKSAPKSNSFNNSVTSSQQSFQQQPAQPQSVPLKAAPKSNSFNNSTPQPALHTPIAPNPNTNQVAKSGSYLKSNPNSQPPVQSNSSAPPPVQQQQSGGVLPSQINKNAIKPISMGIVTKPAASQQQPPVQQQQQQSQPSMPPASRPKSVIQQQPPPQLQRQPSVPQQPTATKPSVNLNSLAASGSRSNSKSNLLPSANFAKHRELFGPHKKFKLNPTFTRSVIGTFDFSYVAPNLQPDNWSVIMPAPPTSMNQNVRSSGLEIYDFNNNWLTNGELLTTDYHYVFRALVPASVMPQHDTGRLRGRFIIEADLYRIDMVETDQWDSSVEPLSPEEFNFYTRPSKSYTLDDPIFNDFINKNNLFIQAPQSNGASNEPAETPLCFAYRVNLFINENFKYNYEEIGWKPIVTTTQIGKGDCGCLTMLYNAILRRSGIPARSVIGRGGNFSTPEGIETHCKSEVWIDNIGWMPVDVTWNLHLKDSLVTKYFGNDCGELIVFHMDEICNIETGVSTFIHESAHIMQSPLFYASGSGNFEGVKKNDQWTVKPIK